MKNLHTTLTAALIAASALALAPQAQAHRTHDAQAVVNSEDSLAFANQYDGIGEAPLSRQQVRDEFEIAKSNGMLAALNSENPMAMEQWRERMGSSSEPALSRSEVRDELHAAQASGELRLINSENPADHRLLDTGRIEQR